MGWIWNSLIHTLIIMAFLFAAVASGSLVIGGIFTLGAIMFFLRSINHPDYFLRRAIMACLNAGLAHIALVHLPLEFVSQLSNETLKAILIGLIAVLDPAPWIGPVLIGFAILFAILENIRLQILKARDKLSKRPHIQCTRLPEETYDRDTLVTTIKILVLVRNPTKQAIDVTNPKIVRRGIWPRIERAELCEYRGEVLGCSLPSNQKSITENGGKKELVLIARFKWWRIWAMVVRPGSRNWFVDSLFGERRAILRTKLANGSGDTLLDTTPN